MAKTSGLGDRLFVAGYNLSGDIGSVDNVHGGPAALDVTGIDKSAMERIGGLRDGSIEFSSFFNPSTGQAHERFSALPTADQIVTYCRGTTVGNPAASCVAKQLSYDGKRGNDGALAFSVAAQANGYGVEWGEQLTDGEYTVTALLTGQNSTFEGGIGTWGAGGNATYAATSSQAHGGTQSLELTSVAGGDMYAAHVPEASATTGIATVPGRRYYISGWFRGATAGRASRVRASWFTSGGSNISHDLGLTVTTSTSAWSQSDGYFTAPANAAYLLVSVQIAGTAGAGEVHYFDDVTAVQVPAPWDYGATIGTTSYGLQMYTHLLAFTGTSITLTVQSSTDDGSTDAYADITGATTGALTTVGAVRAATATNASVERYLRVGVTGTFTSAQFSVMVVRNLATPTF